MDLGFRGVPGNPPGDPWVPPGDLLEAPSICFFEDLIGFSQIIMDSRGSKSTGACISCKFVKNTP